MYIFFETIHLTRIARLESLDTTRTTRDWISQPATTNQAEKIGNGHQSQNNSTTWFNDDIIQQRSIKAPLQVPKPPKATEQRMSDDSHHIQEEETRGSSVSPEAHGLIMATTTTVKSISIGSSAVDDAPTVSSKVFDGAKIVKEKQLSSATSSAKMEVFSSTNRRLRNTNNYGTISYLSKISAPICCFSSRQPQKREGHHIGQEDNNDQVLYQRFALVVAYDGTSFNGLAKDPRPESNTIQQHIENRLEAILQREKTSGSCATTLNGRTDAGVHSNGTVLHFDMTHTEIWKLANRRYQKEKSQSNRKKQSSSSPPESTKQTSTNKDHNDLVAASKAAAKLIQNSLRRGLVGIEGRMEQQIQIRHVYPVNTELFHARKSCIGKQYLYNIHEGYPRPLEMRSCWSMNGRKLNTTKMQQVATETLEGIHDCSILVRDKRDRSDYRSPIREIYSIQVLRIKNNNNENNSNKNNNSYDSDSSEDSSSLSETESKFGRIVIQIQADFFLRNMCRRIVGLLVQVGLGKISPDEVADNLFVSFDNPYNNKDQQFDRNRLLMTAPAKGLCLDYVLYAADGNGKDPTLPASNQQGKKNLDRYHL